MSADKRALFIAEQQKLQLQNVDSALAAQRNAQTAQLREELQPLRKELRELRDEIRELRELFPDRIAVREAACKEALRYNFISCLILAAQNGFGQDVDHLAALCRETWGEEQWWDAVKDLPHGRVRQEGPALVHCSLPFWCERGPFSAGRTHLMYAAQAGDVARLTWLLARGAQLELKDWKGRTALFWAAREGRMATLRALLARGATVDAGATGCEDVTRVYALAMPHAFEDADAVKGVTPLHIASMKGHLEIVRELLALGALPGVAISSGATALTIAQVNGNAAVVQLLKAAGAAP
jgi:hypothetical protein